MTVVMPEVEIDERVLEDLDSDWEIVCEIQALQSQWGDWGFPKCHGDPAVWVAWRIKCCGDQPSYRLVCDHCRRVYIRWVARQACIVCPSCGTETGGFVDFTPLRKS